MVTESPSSQRSRASTAVRSHSAVRGAENDVIERSDPSSVRRPTVRPQPARRGLHPTTNSPGEVLTIGSPGPNHSGTREPGATTRSAARPPLK